jgi:hypothetical protein
MLRFLFVEMRRIPHLRRAAYFPPVPAPYPCVIAALRGKGERRVCSVYPRRVPAALFSFFDDVYVKGYS